LLSDKDPNFTNSNEYLVEENLSIDFNDFSSNDIETTSVKTIVTTTRPSFGFKEDLLGIFVKKPVYENFPIWTSTEQNERQKETTVTEHVRKTSTIPLEDYKKMKNYNEPPLEDDVGQQKGSISFTSGHQNSFGIPIEEDERILKMLNEQLLELEKNREVRNDLKLTHASF
jgi:hypothetical protein